MRKITAFSLIELSIVILIIGILVAGVTQSSRLINQFKLASARSMTQGSPLVSMRDLVLWLEATSEKSFDSGMDNGTAIQNWYDVSPQNIFRYTATQTTTSPAKQPTYQDSVINGLPAVKFDGVNDDMCYAPQFSIKILS